MPVKYTDELKQRAVELVVHAQADPDTAHGAIRRIADELGVSKEAGPDGPDPWKVDTGDVIRKQISA